MRILRASMTLFSFLVVSSHLHAQVPPKSPKEVVKEFWKVETDGSRLTPEGWYRASRFFIRPAQFPLNRVVHVIANGSTDKIEETARLANWAEVSVTSNELGQVDSALRFTPSPQRGPHGVLFLRGPVITFALVLTDKHWELGNDGGRTGELTDSTQWLIDCSDNTQWISVDEAMRYVAELRSKTSDPAAKKNAEQTLVKLKALH